ncbi:hypothetical protein GCK32_011175 [Trichostrongylus colubriformis]|uniref:Endoplasmic reticulum metallopeptidase 1-like C-terminal domain-containing protein n=1 Tax=Trichostrongylus colubriformis TaxID=6319 RepID=A0AAN8J1S9_TRICO
MVAVILSFLTIRGVSSSFVFTLMLVPLLGGLIKSKNEWTLVIKHILLHTPCYGMVIYLSSMVLSIFIPIMGRTSTNPELLVAIMVNFSTYIIVLSLLPLVTTTVNKRAQADTTMSEFFEMVGSILFTAAAVLALMHLLYRSPYNYTDEYPVPRRVQIFHANRAFHTKDQSVKSRDSALFVIAQDYRGAEDIPFVDGNYSKLECAYDNPYCEIPLYFPTRNRIQERHIRYKTVGDALTLPETKVTMIRKSEERKKLFYDFNIKGSNQISVFLVPQSGWRLTNCSLSAPRKELDDRPLFIFLTCSGEKCGEYRFSLTLAHPGDPIADDDSQLLFGIASHYLYGDHMQSHTIRHLLAEINLKRQNDPAWAIAASAWNVDMIYQYF